MKDRPAAASSEKVSDWYALSRFRNEIYGIAAIQIIIFHYFEDVLNTERGGLLGQAALWYNTLFGSIGVEVFLVLSGMGCCFSLKKNPDTLSFIKKRLQRILVLYLICSAVLWGTIDLFIRDRGILAFLSDVSALSFWTEGVRTLWYVPLILALYFIYPLLYRLFDSKRGIRELNFLAALVVSVCFLYFIKSIAPDFFSDTEIAFSRIPVFICGAYLGERIYSHEKIIPADIVLLAIGIICRVWDFLAVYGVCLKGCPFDERLMAGLFGISLTVLLAFGVQAICGRWLRNALRTVGACSFELYLSSVCIRKLMNTLDYGTEFFYNYCLCLALSVAATFLLSKTRNSVKIDIAKVRKKD